MGKFMSKKQTSSTVLIIGAGAAGIAAGARLRTNNIPVTILEARNRIGGRIWTDTETYAFPLELGAEFIHGSGVLTWQLIKRYKLRTLPAIKDKAIYADLNGTIGKFDKLIEEDWEDDIWEAAEAWHAAHNTDASLQAVIDDAGLFNGATDTMRSLVNNLYASDYGADLTNLGAVGLLEADYVGDNKEDGDFRLRDGYSHLLQRMAKLLDVRLDVAVRQIVTDDEGVTVTDANGHAHRAQQVIVTVPIGVLQAGDIDFVPPLPDSKQQAIAGIGNGHVVKLILEFSKGFWKKKMATLMTSRDSQCWWRPAWNREGALPLLTAFIGGTSGERYARMTEAEAIDAGLRDLEAIFDMKAVREHFVRGRFVNWVADPYSKTGYSYNAVGGVGLRDVLAAPLHDRLYFAGEATNRQRPQTVHGAFESGYRAADAILAQRVIRSSGRD